MSEDKRLADFFFEVGTMRKLLRAHRQVLLTDDVSDNISSHSYRVTLIGWFLARKEQADPYKVVMMCLLHDIAEARTNDHNWVHKRYTKMFDDEIIEDQLGTLPYPELKELALEYEKRESMEAKIAKDADLLDQILLLKEYEHQGNKEAHAWLHENGKQGTGRLGLLSTESARAIGEAIYETTPSEWWGNIWTNKNR